MGRNDNRLLLVLLLVTLLVPVGLKVGYRGRGQPSRQAPMEDRNRQIRKAAVAGSFYPADRAELDKQLTDYLLPTELVPGEANWRILIVPHAGLDFSGRTAASGFKQIEGKNYTRVILLGSSHRAWFDQAAVFARGEWETPLGTVAIDEVLAQSFLDQEAQIIADPGPHQQEHSLEIELIFLQKVLRDFKILPILVSNPSDQLVDRLAQKISWSLDDQTLLVISTDLSHYPAGEDANRVDAETIKAILTGSKDQFENTVALLEQRGYPNLETAACGYQAVRIGLRVAEALGIKDFVKIKYENSGEVTGDRNRVVGYAAIAARSEKNRQSYPQLGEGARQEALHIARRTLTEYVQSGRVPVVTPKNRSLFEPVGAFVSYKINGRLRGSQGIFEPNEPLYQVIQKMAIAAATLDPRFEPVRPDELAKIKISVSVISPRKKINNWREIKLGQDGVSVQKGPRSGTFLPQVATETGWSLEEFLAELCSQKAGLPRDCYRDPQVTLFVFNAQVIREGE